MPVVRKNLEEHLREIGLSQAKLSRLLGFGPSYINDFITKESPRELDDRVALQISRLAKMPLSKLGLDDAQVRHFQQHHLDPDALADDVERYDPPRGSMLNPKPGVAYYRLKSDVLELHPLRLAIGDILAFELTGEALEGLRAEQIVLCQLPVAAAGATVRLLLREFVRPGLLVTNRERDNQAFWIEDPSLPGRPRIVGVLRTIERNAAIA